MPVPRFEVPTGVVDGVNKTFYVSVPYVPGTTAVFLNGQLKRHDWDDGWVETDPWTGRIDLKEAPRVGSGLPYTCCDIVQVFFLDTSPVDESSEITPLHGRIEADVSLQGLLSEAALLGMIGDMGELAGVIVPESLAGVVVEEQSIRGIIAEVCR